jgi:hypothetical protein
MDDDSSFSSESDSPPLEMPIKQSQSRKADRTARHRNATHQMAPLSQEEEHALQCMTAWSWELATSKRHYSSPDIGPRGEILPAFDIVLTGYQGLPLVLAQQLKDMTPHNARYFERMYRNEMKMLLAGDGGDRSPEQVFMEAVNAFIANENSSDSSSDDDPSEDFYDAECCEQHSNQKVWPKWEDATTSEDSKWPKWEAEQLEVANRAPADLIKQFNSLDLRSLPPQPEDNAIVTVSEYNDNAPTSPSEPPYDLDYLGTLFPPLKLSYKQEDHGFFAHQETITVCT